MILISNNVIDNGHHLILIFCSKTIFLIYREIDMKTKDVTEKSKLLTKKKENFLYTL